MKNELKKRTKNCALAVIKMTELMPKKTVSFVLEKQIIRSATSVGANYRAALRGRSKAEFAAKLGIVEEEADETCYWLELIEESNLVESSVLKPLYKEANELTAIFTAMCKTAKKNK